VPAKLSPGFAGEIVRGLYAEWPVSISRYRSAAMERTISDLSKRERFDCIVCDFLNASQNIPDLPSAVLFQHNVEAVIWKRQAERARNPLLRAYFGLQARKMRDYEQKICRKVKSIIAVSEADAAIMRDQYGAARVSAVATGVDLEYFAPQPAPAAADLMFVGSMDWLPNIEGVTWFVQEILPLIRKRRPETTMAVVGRKPGREILDLASADSRIRITGTVPDVRPFMWGSALSIVPLRVGGGTRLKIYEAMAAKLPVISTTIGAEGLDYQAGENIVIADRPQEFADQCLALLADEAERRRLAVSAWELVQSKYSWEVVCHEFERLLRQ
jgi:glycosyltransferase involved in cell wall biosynthesis